MILSMKLLFDDESKLGRQLILLYVKDVCHLCF